MDKMIMKVAKKKSNIVKILNSMGPSYVSINTVVGKQDCLRLFPDDYNVEEVEELMEDENETCENEESSKKKKKKKKKKRVQADGEAESQSADLSQDSEDTLDGMAETLRKYFIS
jgi:hypothetical protein